MFKVGDLLVRFGKILKVAAVKTDSTELLPFFNSKSSNGLTYSVQNQNLENSHVRRLVTREKLKQLLELILIKNSVAVAINVTETKTTLSTNQLAESLQLIKDLWLEKQNHAGFLPGGRLSLYQQALSQASEEIAAVKGIIPDQAKLLVLSTLKQGQKHVPEPTAALL